MDNNDDTFAAYDLTLVAYLRLEGFPLLSTYLDGNRVYFVFGDGQQAAKRAREFYDSEEGKRANLLIYQYRIARGLALDMKQGARA